MITAAGIKRILYAETSVIAADLTGTALKAIIDAAATAKHEISNVHGDTWSLEESEPSTTRYKNALTGQNYRQDTEMGDIQASFTIGQYDYQTKADLMGGDVIKNGDKVVGWKRASGIVETYKCLIFQTKDNQWCVFPKGAVTTREANTDKAIGLALSGVALEPGVDGVRSEYWFDDSEVVTKG
ncbi:MAG: hypothetical protein H6Q13_3248 [Bacteroidetes bacterium]|nr:hypothetical protein [Bacteroidota bacterium]